MELHYLIFDKVQGKYFLYGYWRGIAVTLPCEERSIIDSAVAHLNANVQQTENKIFYNLY